MRSIFIAVALGIGAALSLGAASVSDNDDPDCVNAPELVLSTEEFDDSALGNYRPEMVGTITNSSEEQSYDDVSVRVDYYDDQLVMIASEVVEIDKDIEPMETEEFDIGLNPPLNAAFADYSVECAEHDRSLTENLKFWKRIH